MYLVKKVKKCICTPHLIKGQSRYAIIIISDKAEGLKAFLSLSFPRVILGNFGKKPFPEFLKAFPDLERD